MASSADRVLGEALKLEPDERARIAAELLATLEPDLPSQQRSEAEWVQEIERRARGCHGRQSGRAYASCERTAKMMSW